LPLCLINEALLHEDGFGKGGTSPFLTSAIVIDRDQVTGEWRKLYNEELRIIRIMRSRRIKWAGHVARIGRRGTRIGCWWESKKERGH
jgi:hypothetical protein